MYMAHMMSDVSTLYPTRLYIYISLEFCKCKKQPMKRKLSHEIECEFGEHVYLYGNVSSL